MINYIDEEKIYNVVNDTVITVPGVGGFYKNNVTSEVRKKINSTDIPASDYIKLAILNKEKLFYEITISLILFQVVNIYDVCQEIQIRIKHELEKLNLANVNFIINVLVKDVI